MDIRNAVWYDKINARFGTEYLSLYLKRAKDIRTWFKALTLFFSATGVFSVLKDYKIPSAIAIGFVAVIQLISLFESYIIASENDIQKICKLRLMYVKQEYELDCLWLKIDGIDEDTARSEFMAIRKMAIKIEEEDDKVYIKSIKSLNRIADTKVRNYINTYHG